MSDYNATPGLAHVHIQLSSLDGAHSEDNLKVLALHDSGCAKSIMKKSVFDKLLKRGNIEVIQPTEKQALVSCTGEYQEIMEQRIFYSIFLGQMKQKCRLN
jgi:hypothetical protein